MKRVIDLRRAIRLKTRLGIINSVTFTKAGVRRDESLTLVLSRLHSRTTHIDLHCYIGNSATTKVTGIKTE